MASRKKQRKQVQAAWKARQLRRGPFRHPDGDRRRRGGVTADQALAQKRAMQALGGSVPQAEHEEE